MTNMSVFTTPAPPASKKPSGNGNPASSPRITNVNSLELNLPEVHENTFPTNGSPSFLSNKRDAGGILY